MQPVEELRYLVLAVQREGNRQLAELLRPLNLTTSQAEVMRVLQAYQPITLLQLGERLVCEGGSPSRLVKSMVEAGWVEKHPNPADGRAVLLRLSPTAEALLPQLDQIESAFNAQVAALVDEQAVQALIEQLWPFAQNTPSGAALLRRKNHL